MISTVERAKCSLGTSCDPVYRMVADAIAGLNLGAGTTLLDVGCGAGRLHPFVKDLIDRYEGVDIVRYDDYPSGLPFHELNLDQGRAPVADGYADIVVAVETIEHLENPRAFMRELVRLTKPGGKVIVTTPNQLSLLSKFTLLVKNHFNAFADSCYPAHITALLEIDLFRIAKECGLEDTRSIFSSAGRIVFTSFHYPVLLSRMLPRAFSDNIGIIATKPISK